MSAVTLANHTGHALYVWKHNNDADKWVDYELWCKDCHKLIGKQTQKNY